MAYEQYDFLDGYSYSERFFLSHPFLWKVNFNYNNDLIPQINLSAKKSYSSEDSWRAVTEPRLFERNGNMLVAREVTVPNENSQFDIAGAQNTGGFLPGYALNKRVDFLSKNLAIIHL